MYLQKRRRDWQPHCWADRPGTGTFQHTKAKAVSDELKNQHLMLRLRQSLRQSPSINKGACNGYISAKEYPYLYEKPIKRPQSNQSQQHKQTNKKQAMEMSST
eukprot:1144649-Pelagomonas_calceolata.AAC.2